MFHRLAALLFALPLCVAPAWCEVAKVEIETRWQLLDGKPFGDHGAYEKLTGTIHFRFDPRNAANAAIVDLGLAPRNAQSLVEARGDLMVLRPVDPTKGNGTALLEVSNRGGKASLGYFNRARYSRDPSAAEHFGDGFLMRRGFTIIWVGWQFDVPLEEGRLRLRVPIASGEERPIEGLVRSDWVVDETTSTLSVAHRNHVAYPVMNPAHPDNVLTVRAGRLAERELVPRENWRFARELDGEVEDDRTHIYMEESFQAGRIYELVYRSVHPRIVGLGLAAIRDTMSYAKYDEDCPFPVERGLGVGISQTGRFLRHFLYQGFNTDEKDRAAFDGLLIHTAGAGRGSFNHRFGQPSRDGHRYSAFFYPTDLFPFSGRVQRDPLTGRSEGLLAKSIASGHAPKVFYTNTGYEYWGRAASLLHTSLDGSADVAPLPNERIYHLASSQHFVVPFPPRPEWRMQGTPAWRGNPLDFLVTERALLAALEKWLTDGEQPPASSYPRIDRGTLVPIDELDFPTVPSVDPPQVIHEAYRADYGPLWQHGLVAFQPPLLGPAFPSLVSRVDAQGNELAGLKTLEVLVPLATYLPWHLRRNVAGGVGELTDFYGTLVPLARTEAERKERDDERPSIEGLYESRQDYVTRAEQAARTLVAERTLLEEDVPRVLERAEALWDWVHE